MYEWELEKKKKKKKDHYFSINQTNHIMSNLYPSLEDLTVDKYVKVRFFKLSCLVLSICGGIEE